MIFFLLVKISILLCLALQYVWNVLFRLIFPSAFKCTIQSRYCNQILGLEANFWKLVCTLHCIAYLFRTSHSFIENLRALKSMVLWGTDPVSWYLCQVIHYPRHYGIIRGGEMLSMPFAFVHMLEKPQCLLKSMTSWDHVRKMQKKCDLDTSTTLWNKYNN